MSENGRAMSSSKRELICTMRFGIAKLPGPFNLGQGASPFSASRSAKEPTASKTGEGFNAVNSAFGERVLILRIPLKATEDPALTADCASFVFCSILRWRNDRAVSRDEGCYLSALCAPNSDRRCSSETSFSFCSSMDSASWSGIIITSRLQNDQKESV